MCNMGSEGQWSLPGSLTWKENRHSHVPPSEWRSLGELDTLSHKCTHRGNSSHIPGLAILHVRAAKIAGALIAFIVHTLVPTPRKNLRVLAEIKDIHTI